MTSEEQKISDRLVKRENQLVELAQMVVDEMSDPSRELAKLLIKYCNRKFT